MSGFSADDKIEPERGPPLRPAAGLCKIRKPLRMSTRIAVLLFACCAWMPLHGQQTITPEPKTTVIRFYAPVNEITIAQLLNTVDGKLKQGTKRFVLLISSPGGSVFAGLTAYHYLKGIPAEIITHNFGTADSIATVIFCAGVKRYAVPQGRFLLHGVAANLPPNTQLQEGDVDQELKLMQQEVTSIAAVISDTTKKPLSEIQSAISKRTVLTALDAQRWGLVHELRSQLYDEGADLVSVGEMRLPGKPSPLSSGEITYTTDTAMPISLIHDFFTVNPEVGTMRVNPVTPSSDLQSPRIGQ